MAKQSPLTGVVDEAVRAGVAELGFERRGRYGIYVLPRDSGVSWLIGMNRAVPPPYDEVGLNPVLGAEHRTVSREYARLTGLKFEPHLMTVSVTLNVLTGHTGAWWTDARPENTAKAVGDVVEAIRNQGIPFFETYASSLEAMIPAMERWMGSPADLRMYLPIAWRLSGDEARAESVIQLFATQLEGTPEGRQYAEFVARFRAG